MIRSITASASLATLAICALSATAQQLQPISAAQNVFRGIKLAADQGRVSPEKQQTLTITLKLHNQAAYDQAVEELYNSDSATYHHWFTDADFARYAPTAAELKSVQTELEKQGLKVISTNPANFSLRAQGSTSAVESAFQTELHTFTYKQSTFQAHVRDAKLTGPAASLVDSVIGLDRHQVHPQIAFATNSQTRQPLFKQKITAQTASSTILGNITGVALSTPTEYEFKALATTLPIGVYYGTVYGQYSPYKVVSYSPAELQAHYGLTSLIKQGYNGAGQTIALVEAYGYANAQSDANIAAKVFGLPGLGAKNFSVIYPEGKPLNPNAADLAGWTPEIALDIQSAHAVAPGAKIVVVASAGQDNEDQIASLEYIIDHKLANTVSSSWENDSEIISGSAEEQAFNSVLERGAAAGISFQFSSGDSGDQGLETPLGAVSVPSNSPYATAVGGTSILNDPTTNAPIVAGWGTDLTVLDQVFVADPPSGSFQFGAGGGESEFFPKPAWQKALPGSGRQVPDVSAVADPFTGVPVVYTLQGNLYAEGGAGGTSLASPVFTAIWAIADQYNGKPLGFAAPAIARLKPGQITDVVGTSTLNTSDPAGTVYDSNGATFYSALDLFAGDYPTQTQTEFPSAIWPERYNSAIAISFGTDTSLTVTPGWDNVTGYGEPNGLPFIQAVTGKTKPAPIQK